ncbi:ER membrane protein complex subunit 1 isoform X2 [Contarinia nasturtii]|uniref:ER membrane protein complex subunit 1 isoform X2 n=1 Tax=Contarinia nasturtii TaxID=265458 RepID=UPI0012D37316|nr:ER membrane protein complex subunit 1 isoform X2 [Contarinia nasturtii]
MWQKMQLKRSKDIYLSFALILFTIFNVLSLGECLYEDQVGKFDWNRRYVGKVIGGFYDEILGHLLVGTEENVIASLNIDNGDIIWRRVLEKNDRGSIQFVSILYEDFSPPSNGRRITGPEEDKDRWMVAVTGTSYILVRVWNTRTGNLGREWSLTPEQPADEDSHWFVVNSKIYHVRPTWKKSSIEVTGYNLKTGFLEVSEPMILIETNRKEDCVFVDSFMVCVYGDEIAVTELINFQKKVLVKSKTLPIVVPGFEAAVQIDDKIYNLKTDAVLPGGKGTIKFFTKNRSSYGPLLVDASIQDSNINVKVTNAENAESLLSFSANYPAHLDNPRIIDTICKENKKGDFVCRFILATDNAAIVLIQSGKVKWIREESMSDIAAIEMIDLPLADSEGAIEKQLKSDNGDIVGNFIQRVTTQLNHVHHVLRNVFDVMKLYQIDPVTEKGELTRDAFGLHTIIVAVTNKGKLFGIDNISGKQHYATNLPNFVEFANGQPMKIVVQRTSKHFPYPARCTILGRHKVTGNGMLYQFNPIDGSPINGGIIELSYQIRQVAVLQPGADFLRGILLLDNSNNVHVFPESAAETAHGTYIYVSDANSGIVTGYNIVLKDKRLETTETWRINLGGMERSQKIIQIASKNPIEHVHSQGRVLADRSVLYKYINPNLVAIITQGNDSLYKYVVNVHLVDVVSGGIVTTITHRRIKGPVNIVHSENWLVYTYYNDKLRRTELTTIELYEGNTQANKTVWTSFGTPPLPIVEQQAYIIPATIVSMKETITEKGITNKHVLMGLSSGAILEMPWHLLDPRRPILNTNQPREEGTIPYIPELPLSSESVINYNQSVARIKGIYTAPSGLESTSLVVAYGLDFFSVRISPSRTFDLLKEDFDYLTLTSVLIGLTAASFIVKHMSAKKTLKQAWK